MGAKKEWEKSKQRRKKSLEFREKEREKKKEENEELKRLEKERKDLRNKDPSEFTQQDAWRLSKIRDRIKQERGKKERKEAIDLEERYEAPEKKPGEEKKKEDLSEEEVRRRAEKIAEKKMKSQGKPAAEELKGWIGVRALEKLDKKGTDSYESRKELVKELQEELSMNLSESGVSYWLDKVAEDNERLKKQVNEIKWSEEGRQKRAAKKGAKRVKELYEKYPEVREEALKIVEEGDLSKYGTKKELIEEAAERTGQRIEEKDVDSIREKMKKEVKGREKKQWEKLERKADYEKIVEEAKELLEEEGEEIKGETIESFYEKLGSRLEGTNLSYKSRKTMMRALKKEAPGIMESLKEAKKGGGRGPAGLSEEEKARMKNKRGGEWREEGFNPPEEGKKAFKAEAGRMPEQKFKEEEKSETEKFLEENFPELLEKAGEGKLTRKGIVEFTKSHTVGEVKEAVELAEKEGKTLERVESESRMPMKIEEYEKVEKELEEAIEEGKRRAAEEQFKKKAVKKEFEKAAEEEKERLGKSVEEEKEELNERTEEYPSKGTYDQPRQFYEEKEIDLINSFHQEVEKELKRLKKGEVNSSKFREDLLDFYKDIDQNIHYKQLDDPYKRSVRSEVKFYLEEMGIKT